MVNFSFKTKNDSSPTGKPRVYFTCHPQDFDKYFEKIVADIFECCDCVIYYTQDMSEVLRQEDLETDLGQMNLFVVPVTDRLLSPYNRAMETDIAYAKQSHIPILPFMMKSKIDEKYSLPKNFGQMQYLNPYTTDSTEISYKKKLKDFLDAVLIDDELAKRVRSAFDAYIFLSYRKKDRRYANTLMKLIHKNPECQSIAIWFDEFLTPGESFMDGIQKALEDSKLFALLVTPSLLEYVDGKPNFIMAQEYPAAKSAEKVILPFEMEPTDHHALEEKFAGIPACIEVSKEDLFRQLLLQSIEKVAHTAHQEHPEHNFLIGLAYLEGIDVETDCMRGFELISSAAEAGLPEAMKQLMEMYALGRHIPKEMNRAMQWGERLIAHYEQNPDGDSMDTVHAIVSLADLCLMQGRLSENSAKNIIALYEKALALYNAIHPQPSELAAQLHCNLAVAYRFIDTKLAIESRGTAHRIYCELYGPTHEQTFFALEKLAVTCSQNGLYARTIVLLENQISLAQNHLGQTHRTTLSLMHELAFAFSKEGQLHKAQVLYESICKNHPTDLAKDKKSLAYVLFNLAGIYRDQRQLNAAAAYYDKAYWLMHSVDQSDAYDFEQTLKSFYKSCGMYDALLQFLKQCNESIIKNEGEGNKKASLILEEIADIHKLRKDYSQMLKIYEERFRIESNIHSNRIELTDILNKCAEASELLGNANRAQFYRDKANIINHLRINYNGNLFFKKPHNIEHLAEPFSQACFGEDYAQTVENLAYAETVYSQKCAVLGKKHKETLELLGALAVGYFKTKEYPRATFYLKEVAELRDHYLEEGHPSRIGCLKMLSFAYREMGKLEIAEQLDARIAYEVRPLPEPLPESVKELTKLLFNGNNLTPEQIIRIRQKLYQAICRESGELSEKALMELRGLANAYHESGDYASAAHHLQKAHDFAVSVLGEKYFVNFDFEAGSMLKTLTQYYEESGDLEKWVATAQKRYSYCCNYQKNSNADAFKALMEAFERTGNTTAAEELAKKEHARILSLKPALKIDEYRRDPVFSHLITMYTKAGKHAKAIELLESDRAYILSYGDPWKYVGKTHTVVLEYNFVLDNLAKAYIRIGNYRQSITLLEELYANRQRYPGAEHDTTISTLETLAYAYSFLEDAAQTLVLQRTAYELRLKISGETSPQSIAQLANLTVCYYNAGDYQAAVKSCEKIYDLRKRLSGETAPQTIRTLYHLAFYYSKVDDWVTATAYAQLAYDLFVQFFGKDNPETKEAGQFLVNIKKKLLSEN